MSPMEPGARRSLIEGSTLGAGAVLALALLVIVNYFGARYFSRFDWTSSRLYTLSEKSENVLADLGSDVEAVVFMTPANELYEPVRELLSRYEAASPRVTARWIDPERNPAEAQSLVDRYQVASLDVVVFDSGDDRRVVQGADLAEYDYSGIQFGQGPRMTGFKGEQAFTGAILELAESRKPSVLFTSGHGELQIDDFSARGMSEAREILGQDNFEIETWASLGQPRVPEGTDLVVVAGPTVPFAEPEAEVLRAYLDSGGRMLMLLDPPLSESGKLPPTGLESLLDEYGVTLGQDLVIDTANPLPFFGPETIYVNDYGDHPISRSLDQAQMPVILPVARSVSAAADRDDLEIVELLRTSSEGWGETNLAELGAVALDDQDLAGPVPIGVAIAAAGPEEEAAGDPFAGDEETVEDVQEPAEGEAGSADERAAEMRLVVYGDSDFAANGQLLNVGNAPLLANTLNWLVERETLVGIPPKAPEQVQLSLGSGQLRNLILMVLVLMPALAVASGVAVYLRRRR